MMAKAVSKAKSKVSKVKYGLHLGKLIKDHIEESKYSQRDIAPKVNISPQGFGHKLDNPSYGTTYELVDISIALGFDFISPLRDIFYNGGVYPRRMYTESEVNDIKIKLEEAEIRIKKLDRENDLLHKLVEKSKVDQM